MSLGYCMYERSHPRAHTHTRDPIAHRAPICISPPNGIRKRNRKSKQETRKFSPRARAPALGGVPRRPGQYYDGAGARRRRRDARGRAGASAAAARARSVRSLRRSATARIVCGVQLGFVLWASSRVRPIKWRSLARCHRSGGWSSLRCDRRGWRAAGPSRLAIGSHRQPAASGSVRRQASAERGPPRCHVCPMSPNEP